MRPNPPQKGLGGAPRFAGCRPYAQLPVQFSVQRRDRSGTWSETGFLAERGSDPRAAVAQALVQALEGAATVLAYNVGFEKSVIVALAEAVPEHRAALQSLVPRLEDLLPVVALTLLAGLGGARCGRSVLFALPPSIRTQLLTVPRQTLALPSGLTSPATKTTFGSV